MSNEVKRYWHAPKIGFIELDPDQYDEESGYVTYDDYATLEAECERWKERCQYNADTAHAVATERDALHTQLEAIRAAGGEQVEVCDGKEQEAFEEFAKGQKMDMAVHPMHWLFLNKETYAARQGWKAAIGYCAAQHQRTVAAMAAELAEVRRVQVEVINSRNAHQWECERLTAELEAARKQSPIGHVALGSHTGVVFYSHMPQLPDGTKLYALPPLAGKVSVRRELLERVSAILNGLDVLPDPFAEAVELRALLATPSMEVKS